jgi:hypothetical protein
VKEIATVPESKSQTRAKEMGALWLWSLYSRLSAFVRNLILPGEFWVPAKPLTFLPGGVELAA